MRTTEPWTIRLARASDVEDIAALHVAAWRWAYRGLLADATLAALSADEREPVWAALVGDPSVSVLVAERDGALAGFASASASREEDAAPGTGEVAAIYLDENAAGSGLGAELFAGIQDELRARSFTRASLWVLETNARARRFYEREGWRWDGSRSDHQIQCDRRPIVRYVAEL